MINKLAWVIKKKSLLAYGHVAVCNNNLRLGRPVMEVAHVHNMTCISIIILGVHMVQNSASRQTYACQIYCSI